MSTTKSSGGYTPARDIIKRDSKTFVHESDKMRSGWNYGGMTHGRYLFRDDELLGLDREAQLMKAYRACQNRASNLTEKNFSISFRADEKTGSTDGKNVYITTEIIDETFDFAEKINILLGYTTHEVAHILFTDMKAYGSLPPFERTICNIIEDERIENRIGEEFPGYSPNLAAMKQYVFDYKYDVAKNISALKSHPMQDMATMFDLFFKLVRYPKYIEQDTLDKYEMEMDEIIHPLRPYPKTFSEVVIATKKIAKLFDEKFKEKSETGGKPSGSGPGSSGEESEKMKEMLSEAMKSFDSTGITSAAEGMKTAHDIHKIDYRDEWIEDEECKATFRKPRGNESRYQRLKDAVIGDARLLARTMYIKTFNESKTLHGMRNGVMDDNRIVELAHGVNNIYTSKIPKESKKINILVLIDESGSMGGTKCDDAAKAAIIIEQAYKSFPMGELFIYGFTSDYGSDTNTLFRYKERGYEMPFGLGDVSGRSQNRDGDCILAAAKRVREFTNEPFIYFIISDGQPAGSGGYSGLGAYALTRAAVKKVSQMKFFPVQIAIGGGLTEEQQKKMFDHYVNYSDSRSLVDNIRKLINKNTSKIFGI